jgi:hypothetical protein
LTSPETAYDARQGDRRVIEQASTLLYTDKLAVGIPRATLTPLALKACTCTKLMSWVPPVLATLMAATGTQVGDAERDGVGGRDSLEDAETDGEDGSEAAATDADGDRDGDVE